MDKKLLAYCCIVAVMIIGVIVFVSLFFNLQDYKFKGRLAPLQSAKVVTSLDHGVQYAPEMRLIAGICALLLVGHLFWAFLKKVQKCSQADQTARERSLYNISLATGRTEYDLFCKSAEDWSVSGNRIDQDFKRYMTDESLPYYVMDFIRRNHEHIDESLIKKEVVKPTSLWDWAISLLVFPGSLFLIIFLVLIWGKGIYFSM
ncbi:MAG: hypothetical protein PVG96_02225 [Desulfobacterales bacterium]|jgi:hypothetical protein